jgi:CopG family nickel-responsive transcriptional regulator
MAQVVDRFTVSLDTELLAAFDAHIAERGYGNRSEAVRDLIRDLLLEPRIRGAESSIGFITFLCDHARSDAGEQVRGLLAEHRESVRGAMNVPLDGTREAVVVAVEAAATEIAALADSLQSLRGVSYARPAVIPAEQPERAGG